MNLGGLEYMNQIKCQPGVRAKLVLYYHDEEKLTPYQMLNESCSKAGIDLHLKKTGQMNNSLYEHAIVVGDETIVTDFAENNKSAREILAPKALKILEETCYAVIVKNELIGRNIRKWDLDNLSNFNLRTEDKLHSLLENYANSSVIHKLIFYNDFNLTERRFIHEVANKLKLKSKTLDKSQKSILIVTKKLTLWEIVEYLVKNRYSGSQYELKVPTKVKIQSTDSNILTNTESNNRKRFYNEINSHHTQTCIINNNVLQNDSNGWNHYSITEHYNLQQQYEKLEKNKKNMSLSDLYLLNRIKQQHGCRGKLILFQNSIGDLSHYQMIVESAQKSQLEVLVKRTGEIKDSLIEYALEISNEEIVKDFAENNKQAKDILGHKAWNLLQQSCFTIMIKTLLKGREVERKEIDKLNIHKNLSNNDYLGRKNPKIIKLMGSSVKNFENYPDMQNHPIELNENLRHLGLNFSKENNLEDFQKRIIKYLESYVINPCTYNLVFFNEYSVNERKIIFEASLKLKLKAKSFGKEEDRKIVISKKLSPWDIVEHLLARGDENPNYQLIRPTNIVLYNYFYS